MTNHSSPTCVATFADGEVIRMTVWSASGKPDLGRGIRLARVAYQNRVAARLRKRGQFDPDDPAQCKPPAISALHFEAVNGESVTTTKFTAEQIAEAITDKQPESSASGEGQAEARVGAPPAEGHRSPRRSPRKRAAPLDQKTGGDQ